MIKRFLLVALIGALMFAALEMGASIYMRARRGYDGEHLMSYEFDAYKIQQLTPGFRDTRGITHNAQGFRRSVDTPREKPPGTLRVFLMGGSTAYGVGGMSTAGKTVYPVISNDETIDRYLEQALANAIPGRRIEVINAAVTSFQSHHHLIYLNQSILKYDPDVVVFLDGFNDYYAYEREFDQFRDYAYQERSAVFMGDPTLNALVSYTGWWLVRKSCFFHLAGHSLRNARLLVRGQGRQQIVIESALANLEQNARRNWVKMVERNGLILAHERVGALFALQPEIAFQQQKPLSPLERVILDEMITFWPEHYIEFKNRARPIVLDLLRGATARTGSRHADLTDIYGGVEDDVYTDYCHLTPTGNRVLAAHLAPQVRALLIDRIDERSGLAPVAGSIQ